MFTAPHIICNVVICNVTMYVYAELCTYVVLVNVRSIVGEQRITFYRITTTFRWRLSLRGGEGTTDMREIELDYTGKFFALFILCKDLKKKFFAKKRRKSHI